MARKENRPQRRLSIVRDFCLNTSTHGLQGIASAESIHNRLFWSISFVAFTTLMCYFIVTAFISYFQYPTTIDLSYETSTTQYFPAFSLCNIAPMRFDKFTESFINYTNSINVTNTNDSSTFDPNLLSLFWSFMIDKLNRNQSITPLTFSLSSMLVGCSYNYVSCSSTDFVLFPSATYGSCYTFNARMKNNTNETIRLTNQNGAPGILHLELYIHSNQYIPYLMDSAGLLVLVHDNEQLPEIEASGLELAPGRRYKLSFKRKMTQFLSSPFTDCKKTPTVAMESMFKNYGDVAYGYSQSICNLLCKQQFVYEKCGCVSPFLWTARAINLPQTDEIIQAPLCNESDPCFLTELAKLMTSPSLFQEYCSYCSQQCTLTNYPVQLSSTNAPLEWHLQSIKNFVERSSVPLPSSWNETWWQVIPQNYIILNVIQESDIIETSIQARSIGFVDLISNIGGQTGLWLGLSFFSLMEFVEMIYRLIRHQFRIIYQSLCQKVDTKL